ncbi:hypothetical protein ROHU_011127 [Labeo rohita]|uniref:Uncharacterized protein n=1 Tax=Labeo rohita TaxID=84645 RepID=A0A498LQB9_LABRO|nr:hypothetical protein ROHU_011127 [Labeo rohita]
MGSPLLPSFLVQPEVTEVLLQPQLEPKEMCWPGIKPGSTARKAAMLITIPPTQTVDAGFRGQKRTLEAHESLIGAKGAEAIFVWARPGFGSCRARESAAFPC